MTYENIENITDNDLIKLAGELASIKDRYILEQEIYYILDCGANGLRSVLLQYCAARLDKTNEKTKHLKKYS
jgi:hypothetical protein